MADLHQSFLDFNNTIALSSSHKKTLRTSRDAVRDRIRKYFRKEEKGYTPKFHGQGSFMMNAIIEPLDGEFDIDDGIYLQVDSEPSETITTLHCWIYNAVDGHTKETPIDKNPCVRLVYAGEYHVDLPLYYIKESGSPYLAHKTKGWIESDPKEFIDWFNDKADSDGQLKRLVRYLKAWKDYRKGELPYGLVFSILAAQYAIFDDRDDIALYKTLKNIHSVLHQNFACYRPTTPCGENLLDSYSQTNKNYLLDRLTGFINSAEKAIDDDTPPPKACKRWQRHFGKKRFLLSNSDDITASIHLDDRQDSIAYQETEEFIENRYPIDLKYELRIDCKVTQDGFMPRSLRDMLRLRLPLLANKKLKFSINKNTCPEPFSIKWKVCNVGDEAFRRNCIRGTIFDGNASIEETSNFNGKHFVECYLIKGNVCVARDRISVPIVNNRSDD
jgi:Adenylyl/Guanylyl and SMODS C-terminal sensor domain/Second Messenger Oligonucleotide or Dinucleotide Synthetase domain